LYAIAVTMMLPLCKERIQTGSYVLRESNTFQNS